MEVSVNLQGVRYLVLYSCITHSVSYALWYGEILNVTSFHLDDVSCTGNETKLVDCSHRGVGNHNCRLGIDEAAVVCTGE